MDAVAAAVVQLPDRVPAVGDVLFGQRMRSTS